MKTAMETVTEYQPNILSIPKNGLKDFIEYLDATREKLMPEAITIEGEKNDIPVEVSMQYNTSFAENLHSYVNNINTHEGGTHLSGFRRGLTRTLKSYAEKSGLLSKLKFDISGDDFREGLTAVISVKVQEPQFEGQTKTKLGNSEVMGAVDQMISESLTNYLEENPKEAKTIVNKVILAATARHAARKARELVQRKMYYQAQGFPGNFPIVRNAILKIVKSTWWREIRQAEQPKPDVTVNSRPSFR